MIEDLKLAVLVCLRKQISTVSVVVVVVIVDDDDDDDDDDNSGEEGIGATCRNCVVTFDASLAIEV